LPTPEEIQSLLADAKFWAQIQSEHTWILLSVLPRLRPIYTRQLSSFQRKFAALVDNIETIELRWAQSPEQQEQISAQAAALIREAQQLNNEFVVLLNELITVYPETDMALLLKHMRMESQHFGQVLNLLQLALPPENQPLPPESIESFLRELIFWSRDQREHSQLLRTTLPELTANDRETLTGFERQWRALELSARRLLESLPIPGQITETIIAEIRRLALMARNLALEYIRFQEELLSRYPDHVPRFILRHMLKETRRFLEELRASSFFVF